MISTEVTDHVEWTRRSYHVCLGHHEKHNVEFQRGYSLRVLCSVHHKAWSQSLTVGGWHLHVPTIYRVQHTVEQVGKIYRQCSVNGSTNLSISDYMYV